VNSGGLIALLNELPHDRELDEQEEAKRDMARKKAAKPEGGLRDVAVAVGSALGKLAHNIGLGGPAVSSAVKHPKKKIATKAVAPKRASPKKVKIPTRKGW
jgi:hypothetical protein